MADRTEPYPFATLQAEGALADMPAGADAHAEVLLEDASQFILDVCPSAATVTANTRRRIVCAVVRRSIEAVVAWCGYVYVPGDESPFTNSYTPTNPHGDFYLTKAERKALGEGRQKAFGGRVAVMPPASCHRPWCSLMLGALYCSCGADLTGGEPLWEA